MANIDIRVAPLPEAVASIGAKTPVPLPFRSAEIAQFPLALRESAQFSATVENLRYLQYIQDQTTKALNLERRDQGAYVSREKFIAELQQIARQEGITTGDGTLRDPGSFARAKLIYDTQIQRAQGYAKWMRDQDATRLKFYPCQELIRIGERRVPRDWQSRWLEAGGKLFTGRMIATKANPIWTALSRFGTPWPPFDFNSGMGLRDISRHEAEQIGAIKKNEVVPPTEKDFNEGLQASVRDLNPNFRAALKDTFGDQIVIDADTAQWQGNAIADLVQKTLTDSSWNGKALDLGRATARTVELAKQVADAPNLTDYHLFLDPSHIRKTWRDHSLNENRVSQMPLKILDYEMIPHIWREPDTVSRGDNPGDLIFSKNLLGEERFVTWVLSSKNKRLILKTIYKKMGPPALMN